MCNLGIWLGIRGREDEQMTAELLMAIALLCNNSRDSQRCQKDYINCVQANKEYSYTADKLAKCVKEGVK